MAGREVARLAAGLASACLACAGPSQPNDGLPDTRQHVLLVTVDTLRYDHLGSRAFPVSPTPTLDALMADGTRFTRAITPMPRTTPALASLFTGAYPHSTRVRRLVDRLPARAVTLAQRLQDKGFATLAVVSNHVLRPNRQLDRGFDVYDFADDGRGAPRTTAAALRQLRRRDPRERIFLWVHYIDPHMPYTPPAELARDFDPDYEGRYPLAFGGAPGSTGPKAFPEDLPKPLAIYRNALPNPVNAHVRRLYAAEVRHTDDSIAALLAGVAAFAPNWLVVFSADHGESLGENDFFYAHGDYVYNATLRVPLSFTFAEGDALRAGRSVDDWVSLVDVTPTLVELLELPVRAELPIGIEGRSLVPYFRGESLPARPVFAECGESFYPHEVRRRVGFNVKGRFRTVLADDWKLIYTPGQKPELAYELYNLADDPFETRDLFAPDHPRFEPLRRELFAWLRDTAGPRAAADAEDLAMLRALGYID
jgi:arylsulfatase A-like enzyme